MLGDWQIVKKMWMPFPELWHLPCNNDQPDCCCLYDEKNEYWFCGVCDEAAPDTINDMVLLSREKIYPKDMIALDKQRELMRLRKTRNISPTFQNRVSIR